MRLIFLGAPGAGKGTQAVFLSEKYKMPQIATGDILRHAVSEKTELGKKAASYLDSGKLVPDDLILDLVKERLAQSDCKKGYIFDGFPRTLKQAQGLDTILSESGTRIDCVIYFDIEEKVVVDRLTNRRVCRLCGANYNLLTAPPKVDGICDVCGGELYQRSDDNEDTVRQRLQVYHELTEPLKEYYNSQAKLVVVDSNKPVLKVQQNILDIVSDFVTAE